MGGTTGAGRDASDVSRETPRAAQALERLARRYGLSERQREQLAAVLRRLAEDERAPTSVREPERAVDAHLADSLVALELDAVRSAARIADVGAGAGFPGVALAIALTGCAVALVDSQARRCAFVERVVEAAEIENAVVVCARVEQWRAGLRAHDAVLARAVGPQTVVLEYAAPLLKVGGRLVDWRGARDAAGERAAAAAAAQLGMEREAVRRVRPFADARDRHLHVYVKRRETPERFPRRAGIARKRPLA